MDYEETRRRLYAPGFGRTVLAGHQYAAVVADAFCLVHGREEPLTHGDIAGCDGLRFVLCEGETFEEKCYDGLARGDFLSEDE